MNSRYGKSNLFIEKIDSIEKKSENEFVAQMCKIISSLSTKHSKKLKKELDFYGCEGFLNFLSFQSENVDDDEPINEWYEVLAPIAMKVYEDIQKVNRQKMYKIKK